MHTLEKLESKLKKIIGIQKPTGNVRKEQNLGIKNVTDNYLGEKTQILPHSQARRNEFKLARSSDFINDSLKRD